ncbi:ectonucleoside triphosphate diphosphohydrolase 5 isoform X1 [Zootermopsis nevadensis]|uniref:ectonucleoside triphosphate diphosphohydrolase 5 isoform X1 n=1 Tax=Zootermopsis nevadensis TaxID=136037 RepID=UPI000B8EE710|nr:ectonucleoside triphosphate diphosphohydrolase 5 isoform X1 [Zootermopsis nevadensis]
MNVYPHTGDHGLPSHSNKPKKNPSQNRGSMKIQHCFFILTAFVVVSTIVIGSYFDVLPWSPYTHATNVLDKVAFILGLQKHSYAVIIDAGSTASRVLAFTFHESVFDKNLKLDHELFVQVKPGLSSFADNPQKGAEKIAELLERAKEVIPPSELKNTPLAMKATAGLRLLAVEKAEGLLEEVRKLFKTSPFLTNENSVSIMDGSDEGLFSWFTVNFLLDRFGGDQDQTLAALDLGGGSTQVTFMPTDQATLDETKPEFLHHISAFHHNVTVYAQSYLGLGLMAARKEILSVGNVQDSTTLRSKCINPIINTKWSYGGVTYAVMGPEKPHYKEVKADRSVKEKYPIVKFEECLKIISAYVNKKVDKPKELNQKTISAFSYYYDRATEYGLIDPFNGGGVSVRDYHIAANKTCETPNAEQPFMCLDLSFISVLLQQGFGLSPDKVLHLYKQVDGHEISWALGAAFHILQNGL